MEGMAWRIPCMPSGRHGRQEDGGGKAGRHLSLSPPGRRKREAGGMAGMGGGKRTKL